MRRRRCLPKREARWQVRDRRSQRSMRRATVPSCRRAERGCARRRQRLSAAAVAQLAANPPACVRKPSGSAGAAGKANRAGGLERTGTRLNHPLHFLLRRALHKLLLRLARGRSGCHGGLRRGRRCGRGGRRRTASAVAVAVSAHVCPGGGGTRPAGAAAAQPSGRQLICGDRVAHPGQQLADGDEVNVGLAEGVVCEGR